MKIEHTIAYAVLIGIGLALIVTGWWFITPPLEIYPLKGDSLFWDFTFPVIVMSIGISWTLLALAYAFSDEEEASRIKKGKKKERELMDKLS